MSSISVQYKTRSAHVVAGSVTLRIGLERLPDVLQLDDCPMLELHTQIELE